MPVATVGNPQTIALGAADALIVSCSAVDAVASVAGSTGFIGAPYELGRVVGETGKKFGPYGRAVSLIVSALSGSITAEVSQPSRAGDGGDALTGAGGPAAQALVSGAGNRYPAISGIPGLIAFWDFAEPTGRRYSKAGSGGLLPLVQGPGSRATRSAEGPVSGYSVSLNGSSDWLYIAAANAGLLNIGANGGNAVTVFAWVKRAETGTGMIGGIWDESGSLRQYALFVDLPIYGGTDRVCMHISKTGGASPNIPFSRDYSSNRTGVYNGRWEFIAGTYDGAAMRSYIDTRFEPYTSYTEPGGPNGEGLTYDKNPQLFPLGMNSAACEFTVGACEVGGSMSNHFQGLIGGLGVVNRAMTHAEIAALRQSFVPPTEAAYFRNFYWETVGEYAPNLFAGKALLNSGGTDASAGITSWAQETAAGLAAFFLKTSVAYSTGNRMWFDDTLTGFTTDNLASIKFIVNNSLAADTFKLCIRVGTQWYATAANYSVTGDGRTATDWTTAETKTISFARTAASWLLLTATPGSSLVLGSTPGSDIAATAEITGVGFYMAARPTGVVRITDLQLLLV